MARERASREKPSAHELATADDRGDKLAIRLALRTVLGEHRNRVSASMRPDGRP